MKIKSHASPIFLLHNWYLLFMCGGGAKSEWDTPVVYAKFSSSENLKSLALFYIKGFIAWKILQIFL